MDLAALADFNAVAIYGGFGPASRALDRPRATLTRRVAELEEELGVRLIERGSRRMRLTEEGMALHERTRGLLAELQEAGKVVALRAPAVHGRLRISAPVALVHLVLSRLAARFTLTHPEVDLELIAEDRLLDPVEEGYDLMILIDPPRETRLAGHRVFEDERWLVAPTSAARPATRPHGLNASRIPVVVASSAATPRTWTIRTDAQAALVLRPLPVLRLSSLLMVREAVFEGVGAALLPRLLVEDDVAAGRLVRWGTQVDAPVDVWALYDARRVPSPKVRAFIDMIADLRRPA
ncbi:LysR family transcriptional regulator [Pararobbsia silviterrae]|uniref:LysR family transcriptional regulator n=1 Tax=Pararobbsia silviterrae TaxID=1792498 RepID=A0A494XEW6_9BURK|nr:LysR substrate-binding domain-containing protein [Pararobbsia silviterrae]RKP46143.1 LysR family transcriptional regulator [Pararobbsia silviterrae]